MALLDHDSLEVENPRRSAPSHGSSLVLGGLPPLMEQAGTWQRWKRLQKNEVQVHSSGFF